MNIFATGVPRKGSDPRVVKWVVSALDWLGYRRIVLRHDQEPALTNLLEVVKAAWESGEITMEASPVGGSPRRTARWRRPSRRWRAR